MTIDNTNLKKYECPICHKTFKNSHSLASHKYTYHRQKNKNENNINNDIISDKKDMNENYIDNDKVKDIINENTQELPSNNENKEDNI
ncbi:MAG: C2H2-type zinc finger protein, partial [Thermoplasmata archaeon]